MEEEGLSHRISGNARVRDEHNVNMERLMYIPDLALISTLRVAYEESRITCGQFIRRAEIVISFLISSPLLTEPHPNDTLEIAKGLSSVISLSWNMILLTKAMDGTK